MFIRFLGFILEGNLIHHPMKTGLLFFAFLLSTLSIVAQQSIDGIWNTGRDNTTIEIIKSEGKVNSSDNSNAKKGSVILKDLKLESGKWMGKMYVPKKKDWFDAVLELKGTKLLVTIKSGWTSKTVEWTKV